MRVKGGHDIVLLYMGTRLIWMTLHSQTTAMTFAASGRFPALSS